MDKERDWLLELMQKANTSNPSDEDVAALKKALAARPDVVRDEADMAEQNIHHVLQQTKMSALARELLKLDLDNMRAAMGYELASRFEQALIQQVVLSWLRLFLLETTYTDVITKGKGSAQRILFWEKRLNMAQHRYLKACEKFMRIRRIGLTIQFNIATNGGQQINIQKG